MNYTVKILFDNIVNTTSDNAKLNRMGTSNHQTIVLRAFCRMLRQHDCDKSALLHAQPKLRMDQ